MNSGRARQSPYPREIFTDTSGLFALVDEQDQHHHQAREIFRRISHARSRMVLTNFIRAETHALILNRLGHPLADRFLAQLRQSPSTTLIRVTEQDEEQALALIGRYRDKDFSLTDATSFVVMEGMGITHALAFDSDFRQYGMIILS